MAQQKNNLVRNIFMAQQKNHLARNLLLTTFFQKLNACIKGFPDQHICGALRHLLLIKI